LNVTVTDESGIASVAVNLSDIGGSSAQEMNNIPGTDVYTVNTTAAAGTAPNVYYLQVNATDICGNSNTLVNIALTVREAEVDTIPPTIESVTFYPANTTAGSRINISVRASDNIGVVEVTADATLLTYSSTSGLWTGSITAASSVGSYTVTIKAKDAANSAAEATASYNVVSPQGGVSVAVIPKISTVTNGSSIVLNIKINNTANIDDIFLVYLNNSALPASSRADLAWFNWTSTTIQLPSRTALTISIRVDISSGISGTKAFRVYANSITWRSTGYDTGGLKIT
jgi:hypothetical protein